MARNSKDIGEQAERLAREFLVSKGHEIIEVNWRYLKLEIDIISKAGNTIVFSEVKFRSTDAFGDPQVFVDRRKQRRLVRAANFYLEDRNIDLEARFDVISIVPALSGNNIRHLEDAFYPLQGR
jgi:putative endonuclease